MNLNIVPYIVPFEMISVYEVNSNGKIVELKTYWELDKLNEQLE